MVNIGFLGCGFMGQGVHLPNFLANPRCRVIALAEARQRLAREVAARHGIPRVYDSHHELAADPEVQAVVCITPAELHADIVPTLLAAGKHVYVEKPLAYTAGEAMALVAAAAEAGVVLMVAYMKRYDAGVRGARQWLMERLATGELGRIIYARAHCFGGNWVGAFRPALITTDEPAPPVARQAPQWLPEDLVGAYATYVNVYCHNINLLRWFLDGEPQVPHAEHRGGVTVATLAFGGIPAVLETGQLPARRWDESLTIYLERGWLEVLTPPPLHPEPARVRLYQARDPHHFSEPLADWQWSFAAEAEHFIACVEGGSQPLTPAADALRDIAVCEAVFRRIVSQ